MRLWAARLLAGCCLRLSPHCFSSPASLRLFMDAARRGSKIESLKEWRTPMAGDKETRYRDTKMDRDTKLAPTEIQRPPEVGPAPTGRATMLVGIALVLLLIAGLITFLDRRSEARTLIEETQAVSIPTVAVVQPKTEPASDELVLPGNLQAFTESPIFARTNGYLLRWYKDIGSKVQKGDLLAAIDTPEIDQELSQAKATSQQVKAALGLAKISADRWATLRKTDS